MREACGTRDENEEHDALFVLVLPPLLAFTVKKVRVSLLVFVFVRVVVVVAPPLLVKEVIIITEREIIPEDGPRPKCGNPLHSPPPVSLGRR
jgi:hypothetical protein